MAFCARTVFNLTPSVISVVGRHFGLDVAGSAFYLAAWSEEAPSEVEDRLERISRTAETIIEAVR